VNVILLYLNDFYVLNPRVTDEGGESKLRRWILWEMTFIVLRNGDRE
jgi:hypothetical protein